ncbi:hypothetical protein CTEN210_12777 [Chaetoceros tenuissimus]|uniref:Uncharacterized protein n=1 Tax=Chaetoceros tenuissimus TaxID=426638 RepID=A0AAD3D3Y5_9STRA|nr:hypothetical protein CTEN210_12777 [Chaetoceros tenuissimus]
MQNQKVEIFVAAQKTKAPKLPLKEALITVAIECVLSPPKQTGRRKLRIRKLLQRNKKQCTLYSHEKQQAEQSLENYLTSQSNDKSDATIDNSTLSSLTLSKILQTEDEIVKQRMKDFLKEQDDEESFQFDVPSLAASSDSSLDDMTLSTYALVGDSKPRDDLNGIILTKDDVSSNKSWWYDTESGRVSPLLFQDTQDGEDASMIDKEEEEEESTMDNDSILNKEVDAQSWSVCDVSTIVDSTCNLFCENAGDILPQDHDLKLYQEDEDLVSVEKAQVKQQKDNTRDDSISNFNANTIMFEMLSDTSIKPEQVKRLLDQHPQAVKATRTSDGRLPLHILCSQEIQTTQDHDTLNDAITEWVKQLYFLRKMLKLISWSSIEACAKFDKYGDLPCHLLARNLLSWCVQVQSYLKQHQIGYMEHQRLLTLTKVLTECVDILIRPICTKVAACSATGSKGTILPLHISIMFGGSVDVFRRLLETYPNGARIRLKTEYTGSLIPLVLNDIIRTDQLHYQNVLSLENTASGISKHLQWPASLPFSFYTDDLVKRSDWLFCYYPSISYMNEERMNRLETMIKSEAKQETGFLADNLSPTTSMIWSWFCESFKTDEQELERCELAVDRILKGLKPHHVGKLAYSLNCDGNVLLDFARPSVCRKLEVAMEILAIEEERRDINTHHQKREVNGTHSDFAETCRSIFAIREETIPIAFVIFPFEIEPSNDGGGMLVSERNAKLAVQFANFMMEETSDENILKHFDEKLQMQDNLLLEKERDSKESVAKLYRKGGWLYFIDEISGTPIIPDNSKTVGYPIQIGNASKTVQTLLPLMRLGMIHMRLSQRVDVLSNVILKSVDLQSFKIPIKSWSKGAELLVAQFNLEGKDATESVTTKERKAIAGRLTDYILNLDSDFWTNNMDWTSELSLLQLLFEGKGLSTLNIKTRTGLHKLKLLSGESIWTTKQNVGVSSDDQILGKYDGYEIEDIFADDGNHEENKLNTDMTKKNSLLEEMDSLMDDFDNYYNAIEEDDSQSIEREYQRNQ